MIRWMIAFLKSVPAILSRLRYEPVMLASGAMVALTAFQEAARANLGAEDLWIFVGEAVIGWFARELVYPAVRVEERDDLHVIEPEPALPLPVLGDVPPGMEL